MLTLESEWKWNREMKSHIQLAGLLKGCGENYTMAEGIVKVIKIPIIDKCTQCAAKLKTLCVGRENIWCKSKD